MKLRRVITMDDVAAHGDLVGDSSDEPRFGVADAVELLTVARRGDEVVEVLRHVKPRERAKVIRRAERRRARTARALARGSWDDRPLPFDGAA